MRRRGKKSFSPRSEVSRDLFPICRDGLILGDPRAICNMSTPRNNPLVADAVEANGAPSCGFASVFADLIAHTGKKKAERYSWSRNFIDTDGDTEQTRCGVGPSCPPTSPPLPSSSSGPPTVNLSCAASVYACQKYHPCCFFFVFVSRPPPLFFFFFLFLFFSVPQYRAC